MKTLVTGCAGFIGSHLVDKLLEHEYEDRNRLLHRLLPEGNKGSEHIKRFEKPFFKKERFTNNFFTFGKNLD